MPETLAVKALDPGELDQQHAELARRAHELSTAIRRGDPDLGRHLEFLQSYAVAHFGAEEEHMRAAEYPGYLRHQAEHDRFIEDLLVLADTHEKRGAAAFEHLRTEQWLRGWLDRHVGGTDMELLRFLAGR